MQFENPIDNLTYLYDDTNKNQLLRVFDSTANPQGFSDDSDGISDTEDDYAYDDNGNMTHDDNKGITHITYNHLNLPVEIIFGTYGKIAYLYNATGQKLKKTVTEGTTITTTDYLSGFQYKNLVLQFFPHAEGYVNATEEMVFMGGTSYRFNYVFNYTDHLGNIRLSYSLDPSTKVLKIIEENHYYPFGLKHSGYNSDKMMYTKEAEVLKIKPVPPLFITSYKYKYNGKEYQDELGINFYDYGARNYDPALGRWMNVDPLAEKFADQSPYSFVFNNPVYFIDPDGMAPEPPKLSGIKTVANVMSSQKWINYNNNITRTTTFLGFEVSRSSKREQCADYSRLQVEQGSNGNYTAVGSKSRVDMYVEKGGDTSKLDLQKGVDTIIENLNEGKGVMAGVMYNPESETGNPNGATNHYVTIVGMGTDDQGAYFSYYDNYSGKDTPSSEQEAVGTDISKNKFRLQVDSKGNYYFADADNNIPYNGNKEVKLDNKEKKPARYVLTEVRDNN